jgi:hypothetical protein
MSACTHPQPVEFGASEVVWDEAGLIGHAVLPCEKCGEYIRWEVTE